MSILGYRSLAHWQVKPTLRHNYSADQTNKTKFVRGFTNIWKVIKVFSNSYHIVVPKCPGNENCFVHFMQTDNSLQYWFIHIDSKLITTLLIFIQVIFLKDTCAFESTAPADFWTPRFNLFCSCYFSAALSFLFAEKDTGGAQQSKPSKSSKQTWRSLRVRPAPARQPREDSKDRRHPFALYGSGEKEADIAGRKTHNVCPAASTHEVIFLSVAL